MTVGALTVGQRITLDVEKPAAGGRMIARHDGQIVFVADAIPGERVVAQVTRVAKGTAFADTVAVDAASPDRRPAFTDSACGGSAFAHIEYPRQLTIKADIVTDGLARIGHVTPPAAVAVRGSRPDGYRMRARLHASNGRIGFFREGTHEVCDARATRQLLDATNDVLDLVAAHLHSVGGGAVRELEVSENRDATQRALHLLATAPIPPSELAALGDIAGVTGVMLSAPSRPGQAPDTTLVAGDPYVFDALTLGTATVRVRRHVQAFFQGNRYLLDDLVTHVAAQVPERQRVVDLYAGVGLFALAAAVSRDASVVAVEGDPFAARDLEINASALRGGAELAAAPRVDVSHQSVERYLTSRPAATDVVVLDPPRTGVSPDALRGLIALQVPRLVYVSCDVATLARDLRHLVEAGYRLERVDGFDLFPNTAHVETVVVLTRR